MNKEIYRTPIDAVITDVEITKDEGIKIHIGEKFIEVSTYHSQDCCEAVWGDFSILKLFKSEIVTKNVKNLIFKAVDGAGFLLVFELDGYDEFRKVFIPCYNRQNGYYSSNLSLVIKKDNVETTVDISNLVEDHID